MSASAKIGSLPVARMVSVILVVVLAGGLFGYDQGVISGIITMESFGVAFPRIYSDSGFKGWFVSTLLLGTCLSKNQFLGLISCSCLVRISGKWPIGR